MDKFLEKWKSDKRYRTKIKLLAYTVFVVIVSIYAFSINDQIPANASSIYENSISNNLNSTSNTIDIPTYYTYKITVNIDNEIYIYNGKKTPEEETITKESNGVITNYRYANNEYYVLTNNVYELTNKESLYDNVNCNYIDIANINKYLSKAEKDNNEYHVYLKDIILGNDSTEYFKIKLNDNNVNIDYTPLIKEFNNNIQTYLVDITIENN